MKTKLEMAHDYAVAMLRAGVTKESATEFAQTAFVLVDAMQAEADKRVAEATHKEEWQPDWSQAPMCDVVAWDINEHGQARWIASDNGYYLAPSFDYQGDWRDSLRKRPN